MRTRALIDRLAHNWPEKILSLIASILLFLFYRVGTIETRTFSVPLQLIVHESNAPSSNYPRAAQIKLRGKNVFNISEDDIEVYADFSDHSVEGEFKESIEYNLKGTAIQNLDVEITVKPFDLTIVLEKKLKKTLEVIPLLRGYAAKGYERGQYFVTPHMVNVVGPKSAFESVDYLETEEINITNLKESITKKVKLAHPNPFIQFPNGDIVEVDCVIQEKKLLKTYENVDIIMLDLPADFTLASPINKGSVKIQGSQLILEKISPGDIILTVDCSEVEDPGEYSLDVTPQAPQGLLMLGFEPQNILINVIYYDFEDSIE